jgi:hypothetical protein
MCPEAEKADHEVVSLPIHPRVCEKTARKAVEFAIRYGEAK